VPQAFSPSLVKLRCWQTAEFMISHGRCLIDQSVPMNSEVSRSNQLGVCGTYAEVVAHRDAPRAAVALPDVARHSRQP